jgi:hypothetical protein
MSFELLEEMSFAGSMMAFLYQPGNSKNGGRSIDNPPASHRTRQSSRVGDTTLGSDRLGNRLPSVNKAESP